MKIELTPSQEAWIKSRIASGRYTDEQNALDHLMHVADLCAPLDNAELQDLSWTLPEIDHGLADIEAGNTVSSEIVHDRLRKHYQID